MSDNKNTEMAKRVEQAKKKILQEREDMKKGAIKLTAKLLKGIKYEEEFPVKLVNGQIGLITIRPLAEEEMITIFDDLGLDRVSNMGQGSGLSLEDYEFFWSVVAASSGFDKKIIKTTFAMGESAAVGQRILEISGMIETAPDEVEKFLKSNKGLPYTLLILKGHKLDDNPIGKMTRLQILAYMMAQKIENDEQSRAKKRANRGNKRR